jgi:hypothetical protein
VPATLVTQAQLELRVGVHTVARYCCDDGSDVANPAIVDEVLSEAEDEGIGLLGAGFTPDQIVQLATDDASVRGAFLDIAADLMGRRRPSFLDAEGRSPFSQWRKRAEDVLERAGQAQRRFKGESTAGRNRLLGASTNRQPHAPIFVGTKDNPTGSGGF